MIWKAPVTITYSAQDHSGFLNGSEISDQLRNLTLVEFSFFLGFPVKQIAERECEVMALSACTAGLGSRFPGGAVLVLKLLLQTHVSKMLLYQVNILGNAK